MKNIGNVEKRLRGIGLDVLWLWIDAQYDSQSWRAVKESTLRVINHTHGKNELKIRDSIRHGFLGGEINS